LDFLVGNELASLSLGEAFANGRARFFVEPHDIANHCEELHRQRVLRLFGKLSGLGDACSRSVVISKA
jgi:hypothetical protein